ncbi:hypothetical protein [Hymenobacter sp. APR13]|uniref:hypothetical protein n=1 Tax=Hymenobacter sp. APR13 TaxID=1356852 RepID=UPI0012E0395A|nr:hypothetical protein [Hymenobacter sp. APR13]
MRAFAPVPFRALLAVGLLCLLASSMGLLLIFGPTAYAKVQALGHVTYHEGSYRHLRLALTPARYLALRGGLLATILLSMGGLWLLRRREPELLHREARQLRHEARLLGASLRRTWQQLGRGQQVVFGSLLLVLLLVRLWYLVYYPISTDEAASFDYFIHEGPVAISSFYPIPNNHLLFNFVCWPLSWLSADLRVVMRLPTLLLATAGTSACYLLLTRQMGFRAATLSTGFFSFTPLGLYYAVAGRGYFLQLVLLLAVFFAAMALWRRPLRQRLAWVVFVGGSILGLYTIPTFVYPLTALGLGLLLRFGGQQQWQAVGRLALAGASVVAATSLLYTPVIAVSGLPRLLGNRYVEPLSNAVFWPRYAGHLRGLADMLAGNGRLGLLGAAGLLAAWPLLWKWVPRQRPLLALGSLLLAVPLLLMALQQVLTPARVLLFVACFGSILAGVAATALLNWLRVPTRWQLALFLLLIGGYEGYQFRRQLPPWRAEHRQAQLMQASYRWLVGHGARRVFLASPQHELFMHHYALQQSHPPALVTRADPHQTYDFVVLERDAKNSPAWTQPPFYTPAYQDRYVVIYRRATTP